MRRGGAPSVNRTTTLWRVSAVPRSRAVTSSGLTHLPPGALATGAPSCVHVAEPTPRKRQARATLSPVRTASPGAWLVLEIAPSVVGVEARCTPTRVALAIIRDAASHRPVTCELVPDSSSCG
jgi:hypothetical protein